MTRPMVRTAFSTESGEAVATEGVASRRHILDCAARLVRRQGYAATSLRDIAAASGMKAGSLYYHFASKEEIVTEMLNIGVQTVFGEVRRSVEALGDPPAASRVETAVRAHMRAIFEIDDYNGASIRIFGQVPPRVRDAALGERDAYEEYWHKLLEQDAAEGRLRPEVDRTLLRLFLFGAMNWALEWYDPAGKYSVTDVARALSDIVLRGSAGAGAVASKPPRRRVPKPVERR
ncbi:MAG TPA: TetR/AcrR family transcriptional regulator [Candidatus Sulfotelmatobacter sp.]|nr:TetR/AcrR family transcriptional regulator [Candidatus Sulfotelmatobacter sp.]